MSAVKLLNTELRRIWKLAIRQKWSKDKLQSELNKATSVYYTKVFMQEMIAIALPEKDSFDWFKDNVSSEEDYKTLTTIFNKNYTYYSRQKEGLNSDIIEVVSNGIANDLPDNKIISELEFKMTKWQQHAKTIVNTAQQQLSMLKYRITAEEAGVEKFRYSGPPPQRKLCKAYYQKEFTLKEIKSISERLGYDFFIERGLWNCRHFWEAVV
jgi:hypothetical protein